jgi:hypothetical protein
MAARASSIDRRRKTYQALKKKRISEIRAAKISNGPAERA